MRQMVGLVQRRGIFYVRCTIPDALRADMPAVLGTAGPGIFDESAPVSLKGRRAGREFWVSLGTRDADVARDRARRLDGEADALVRLAKRRLALSAQPKLSDLDDTVLQGLVATFRHRKLAADEGQRQEDGLVLDITGWDVGRQSGPAAGWAATPMAEMAFTVRKP